MRHMDADKHMNLFIS